MTAPGRRSALAGVLLAGTVAAFALAPGAQGGDKASHAGWPKVTGMLLINARDGSRPLDGRPGHDPFDGTDPTYKCDEIHDNTLCIDGGRSGFVSAADPTCRHHYDCGAIKSNRVPAAIGHNELLGGGGDNVIHAGPSGDIVWGYYKGSGAPHDQVNRLYGGPGDDFIYAGHGYSEIWTGGGRDAVHAHFGRGVIHCQSPTVVVWMSHRSRRAYTLDGCHTVTYRSDAG